MMTGLRVIGVSSVSTEVVELVGLGVGQLLAAAEGESAAEKGDRRSLAAAFLYGFAGAIRACTVQQVWTSGSGLLVPSQRLLSAHARVHYSLPSSSVDEAPTAPISQN